jgi:RND family efflux transporter MFP subunit
MIRIRQAIAPAVFVIAILSSGLSGCGKEQQSTPPPVQTLSNVAVIVAHKTAAPDWMATVGTVRAAQSTQVSSQMMGAIVEIRAHEGDRVQAGQLLAVIDEAQPRSMVNQATAAVAAAGKEVSAADSDLTLAETTLKRYQQLYDKKSISPQEFDEVKARYQSASARRDMARAGESQANSVLTQAQTSLSYTQIRSPFSGVVTEKKADTGTLASPGMPLFTIEDTRVYRLEVMVDESEMHLIRIGEAAPVTIDALGNTQFSGKVTQIVPAAEAASRSFLVKIALPADARLRSGSFGRAHFPRGERQTLQIPRASVVQRGQLQGVYVIDANQIAELRYVTLGNSTGEMVEVLAGLQDGDKLVAAPGDREVGGKRIAERQ